MQLTIGIVAIVVVIAAVLWFVFGGGPFDEEGIERPTDGRDRDATKGYFGPAGPGAERQAPS